MRVVIDRVLCEGNGICARLSPEVFRVGDDDQAEVLVERPDQVLHARVEAAARGCPRRAIHLLTD